MSTSDSERRAIFFEVGVLLDKALVDLEATLAQLSF
jgi:hypothetical protein